MENLDILTSEVCKIARKAGFFLKNERKEFRYEAVQTKRAHDYVSYVDKQSELQIVEALRRLLPEAGFIAEEGSAVYNDEPYCWVVDPLDEAYIGKWDFSAAALINQEAGGLVTDFYGSKDFIDGHHIVATNGLLHDELLKVVQESMPKGL